MSKNIFLIFERNVQFSNFSGLNPALAAQIQASAAAQMGNGNNVSGIDISNLTAMHAMLQKQHEL